MKFLDKQDFSRKSFVSITEACEKGASLFSSCFSHFCCITNHHKTQRLKTTTILFVSHEYGRAQLGVSLDVYGV